MRCDQAQELFSDRLEGLLERPMAIAFDHHLSECSECSHQYGAFKTTWQMLESLPEVAPPPGFACDVMMKIQLQREAERRARSWWQTIWSEKFMPKIPARAYAGAFAAAAVVLAAVLLLPSSPQKTDIPATLKPAATTVDAPKPVPVEPGKLAAEAWLHSGLTIEFDGYKTGSRAKMVRLMLKPKGTHSQHVRVYLLDSSQARLDTINLQGASSIFDGEVDSNGQPIPFILGQNVDKQEVMTAIVEWEYQGRNYREAVFVPSWVNPLSPVTTGSLYVEDQDFYSALQEISATFGIVLMANGDINARVSMVVENGKPDDALWKLCSDLGLSWRQLPGTQVYSVERKL